MSIGGAWKEEFAVEDEDERFRLEQLCAVAAARIAGIDEGPNPKLAPLRDVMGDARCDALRAAEALNPTPDVALFG